MLIRERQLKACAFIWQSKCVCSVCRKTKWATDSLEQSREEIGIITDEEAATVKLDVTGTEDNSKVTSEMRVKRNVMKSDTSEAPIPKLLLVAYHICFWRKKNSRRSWKHCYIQELRSSPIVKIYTFKI